MDKRTDYRTEKDSIGEKKVPEDVYYGVQSLRAAENFHITGLNMHPEIINSLAYIKKAAAITNCEIGILDKDRATAIVQACDEISHSDPLGAYAVDRIQHSFTRMVSYYEATITIDFRRTAEQIAAVKDDLDYQLAYEALGSEGDENGPYRYPENPNYNLTASQRFLVVRNYYMNVTDDPDARLQAFAMDTLAQSYLGEFYATLYSLLASYCE